MTWTWYVHIFPILDTRETKFTSLRTLLFIKLSVAESTTSAAKDEEAQGSKKTRFPVRRRDSETGVVTINLTPSSASRLLEAAEKSKKGGGGGEADGSSSAAKQKVSISL